MIDPGCESDTGYEAGRDAFVNLLQIDTGCERLTQEIDTGCETDTGCEARASDTGSNPARLPASARERERVLDRQPSGPNPLYLRDDVVDRPARATKLRRLERARERGGRGEREGGGVRKVMSLQVVLASHLLGVQEIDFWFVISGFWFLVSTPYTLLCVSG